MVCDAPSAISSWLVRRGRSRCTGSEAKSRDQMSATRASNDGVAMERVDDDSDDDTLSLAPLLVVLLEIEMLVSSEGSMAATAPPCVADAGADDGAGGADNDDNDDGGDGGDRVADGADEARGGW